MSIPSPALAASPLHPRDTGMLCPTGSRCLGRAGRGGRGVLPTCPPLKATPYPKLLPAALPARTAAGAAGDPLVSSTSAGKRERRTPLRGMRQGKGLQIQLPTHSSGLEQPRPAHRGCLRLFLHTKC